MIPVSEALAHLFDLVEVLPSERVPLRVAHGRVLREDVMARRSQPPFSSSAMDGYALRGADARGGAVLEVVGEAAAGRRFDGVVQAGQAVRIFTGAPVPEGADLVVIQEDVTREGDRITLNAIEDGTNIRPEGNDFKEGQVFAAGKRLSAGDVALLAAMNVAEVPVTRRPEVALMSTGDELVMPGDEPGPDQIVASNTFGLAAMLEQGGALPRILPIARDNRASLETAFKLAEGADIVVTIGGASVGDHDIVAQVAGDLGLEQSFYKVAMRPGKPLMAGRMGDAAMLGLPGNPVSAMVCGHIFLMPMVRKMLGLGAAEAPRGQAALTQPVSANGPRAHYMRATLGPEGITPAARQDSALLSVLSGSNVLLIRPPHDGPRAAGEVVEYIALDSFL